MDTLTLTAEQTAFIADLGLAVTVNDGREFLAIGYLVRKGHTVDRDGWTEVTPGSGKLAPRIAVSRTADGTWSGSARMFGAHPGLCQGSYQGPSAREAFRAVRATVQAFRSNSWAREGYEVRPA